MTQPTDSLIERIEESIRLVREADDWFPQKVNDKLIQTLTDCHARLSPPVIDGEVEEEYKNALEQLDDMPMLGNCSKYYSAVKRIKKALTALHDELARKDKEIEKLREKMGKYLYKCSSCNQEINYLPCPLCHNDSAVVRKKDFRTEK